MKNIFENKSVENLIEGTLQNLHTLVEANTIVGEEIVLPGGVMVVPISKVTVGYVVGGGEYLDVARKKKLENFPLAGGSGGGVSISPVGFLISGPSGVEYVDVEKSGTTENLMKLFETIVKKFGGADKDEN